MSGAKKEIQFPPYHPFRSEKARQRFLRMYEHGAQRWPVPSTTRLVETSFGHTFVRISGPENTPPLVLLHGIDGNSLQWIPNIKALAESFKTYAVDGIYDHGLSVYARLFNGPEDFVSWLDELLHTLEPKNKINLVGLSYGGWQAINYALRFPERLLKLVLLAPAGTVLPIRPEWLIRAACCALPCRYFTKTFLYWILQDSVRKDDATRKMVDEWVEISFTAMRCFKPKRLVNPAVLEDAQLASLRVPTLFLVGENEKLYPPRKVIERLNRVTPQIKTELIAGAGHDLTIAQAETVNRKIIEFLKQSR
ncbi:MAG: alpha/beta fold hydrolase [Candidatus Aminicenantales bacterium]